MQIPDFVNKKVWWSVSAPIVTLNDINQNVDSWQDDRLGISTLDNYTETRQKQDFSDYKAVPDK